eukprot:2344867-Lingulodinium_polyedra.AAC.1
MTISCPRHLVATGKRRSAAKASGATAVPATRSHLWVDTESPAAWPTARRKHCIRNALRGPRCSPREVVDVRGTAHRLHDWVVPH